LDDIVDGDSSAILVNSDLSLAAASAKNLSIARGFFLAYRARALSAGGMPRIELFVWQTLESGVICLIICLGCLLGGLVRFLLMLLSSAARAATARCLGAGAIGQQHDRQYRDD
jgi:hypothetical protein